MPGCNTSEGHSSFKYKQPHPCTQQHVSSAAKPCYFVAEEGKGKGEREKKEEKGKKNEEKGKRGKEKVLQHFCRQGKVAEHTCSVSVPRQVQLQNGAV